MSSTDGPNRSNTINAYNWTLFDKVMYGGLGYGSFCLPSDFFKVIITILFPPLGEVCNIVEDTVSTAFPYLNWKTLKAICIYDNLKRIVYSFLLTTLFYVPGLIYTLTGIVNKQRKVSYDSRPVYWDENKSWTEKTKGDIQTGYDRTVGGLETGYDRTVGGLETGYDSTIGGINQSVDSIDTGINKSVDGIGSGIDEIEDVDWDDADFMGIGSLF